MKRHARIDHSAGLTAGLSAPHLAAGRADLPALWAALDGGADANALDAKISAKAQELIGGFDVGEALILRTPA